MQLNKWKLVLALSVLGIIWFLWGETSGNNKIWIFFKDRPYSKMTSKSASQLVQFSQQAIQRRSVRGLESWTDSDLPVEATYVNAVQKAGAKVLVMSRWLNAVSANCNEQCRSNLSKLPFISAIQPVGRNVKPSDHKSESNAAMLSRPIQLKSKAESANLDYGPSKAQLDQIGVPEAHKQGFFGQDETVALFSTGFLKDHLAFQGHEIIAEYDFVHHKTDCGSGNPVWEGTAAWSTVNGEYPGELYGPAFKSKVILAATDQLGDQTIVEEDNWVAAFEFADQNGASVIDGTLGYSAAYKPSDYDGVTSVCSRIASMAAKKGIVVTSSMGISGQIWLPSDAMNILSVGIVDSNGLLVPFSTRGPSADGRIKPEVVARGTKVFKASTLALDAFTSQNSGNEAASFVAGGAAVVLSAHPDWNPLQVREALMKTASRADHPDNSRGYGLINVAKAIDFLPTNAVVIDHVSIKTKQPSQPISVVTRIRAQQGLNLNQLNLFWKKQTSSNFQRVSLKPVIGTADNFEASIPAQMKGTTVQYYLVVKDKKGKTTRAPFGSGKFSQLTIS